MSVNNVGAKNSIDEVIKNWKANGGDEVKNASMSSGIWTIEEVDGDVFTLIGSQWVAQGKSAESIVETNGKEAAPEILSGSISELERRKAENDEKIKLINEQILKLKEEVEADVKAATDKMTEIGETTRQEINKCVSNLSADLASGKLKREDFDSQLSSKFSSIQGFAATSQAQLIALIGANTKISTIELLANEIGILQQQNTIIDTQIAAAEAAKRSCDPIGFEIDGVKFDFFIDKDMNGLLSNENEFLGAEDGWNEVTALDVGENAGDGKLDKNEMAAAGLMVVVTAKDGTQKIMKASDLFGENDFIDLNAYKAGGTAQDLVNNGVKSDILDTKGAGKNKLLGTFGLTLGGQEYNSGYQTLDDVDWLKDNYSFSDNWVGPNAQVRLDGKNGADGKSGLAGIVGPNGENYEEIVQQLREMVTQALEYFGFSEEAIEEFTKVSYKCAQADKTSIVANIDAKAKEKVDADEKAKADAELAEQSEIDAEGSEVGSVDVNGETVNNGKKKPLT